MKTITKLLLVLLLISFASCRDIKKEEEEAKAVLQEIEAVETEIKEVTDKVEQSAQDLELALKELDSI